ncbi:MAG: rRNA maturation RNase YbeY [Sphaerochaeta sp.]|jgi:probable rRNA maturation factor|uniref:rRNA maturation RNase YbeY n=1 Tax=Sphaerochaeta sp. TaxID=1972642 RepID=UPI002FC8DF1D
MNYIDVSYELDAYTDEAPEAMVLAYLEQVAGVLDLHDCEFSVSFVSDASIQALNQTYRDKDEPTDILSFVQEDEVEDFSWPELHFDEEEPVPQEIRVLGDMVISLDTLKRNALSFSVEPAEELHRLLIHGLLHLLGEDHATNDADEPMLVKQEQLLAQVRGSKR